jgi:hypothetical protein
MDKEERKSHVKKFNIFNNYLLNGMISFGFFQKNIPQFTKVELVIEQKQQMKMNIILSIITMEILGLFKLQKEYLQKINEKDKFYEDFDLDREWIFFCICVFDKIKLMHEINNTIVQKTDIFKILENVRETNLIFIQKLTQALPQTQSTLSSIKNNIKDAMSKTTNVLKDTFKYVKSFVTTVEEKPQDCVKQLFVDFIYILYQYEYDRKNFPLTINITNGGDSTKYQDKFLPIVNMQREYYERKFNDIINLEYFKANVSNKKDQVQVAEMINEYEKKSDAADKDLERLTNPPPITGGGGNSKTTRKFWKNLGKVGDQYLQSRRKGSNQTKRHYNRN